MVLGRQPVGVGLGVDRADELRGVGERVVVGIDLGHGQDGGDRLLEGHEVPELLLDEVVDHALSLGPEDVEGIAGVTVGVARGLEREEADLRSVAVRDDELVGGRDRGEGPAGHFDALALTGDGQRCPVLEQGVSAKGNDHTRRAHQPPANVATMIALIVCMRFSAWSNTIERADSNTSSVTSRLSRPVCS